LRARERGPGVGQIGFGALQGNPVVPRVHLDEHRSHGDALVVLDLHRHHRTADARRHCHDVPVHLRIVGGLAAAVIPPAESHRGQEDDRASKHERAQARPGAEEGKEALAVGRCRWFRCLDHVIARLQPSQR